LGVNSPASASAGPAQRDNDLEPEEVDHVLLNYESTGTSRTTGRPCVFGYTPDGRYIIVVYEEIGDDTIMPWTAYEVTER